MTRLFVVRHGESEWNVRGLYNGRSNEDRLTARGEGQSRALAKRLAREGIQAVYSSPLRRALETATILNPNGSEIVMHPGLLERELGDLLGRSVDEVRSLHPDWFSPSEIANEYPAFQGVETFPALQQRGLRALKDIAEREAGRRVLVVSHGSVLRAALAGITGLDSRDQRIAVGNCTLTVLGYRDGRFSVELLNEGVVA